MVGSRCRDRILSAGQLLQLTGPCAPRPACIRVAASRRRFGSGSSKGVPARNVVAGEHGVWGLPDGYQSPLSAEKRRNRPGDEALRHVFAARSLRARDRTRLRSRARACRGFGHVLLVGQRHPSRTSRRGGRYDRDDVGHDCERALRRSRWWRARARPGDGSGWR